jgi:hypothetical protein
VFGIALASMRPCFAQGVVDLVSPAIEQDPLSLYNCNQPADLDLAVGASRVVLVSNCKVRLLDLSGATLDEVWLRHSVDTQVGLVGLFQPSVAAGGGDSGSRVFDPRVHWDAHNERFWIVAAEYGVAVPGWFDQGWLRVAVSRSASPDNLSTDPATGDWYSFVIDVKTDLTQPLGGFPDLPRINTDGETLHIAVGRDLECDPTLSAAGWCPGVDPVPVDQHRTVLVAIPIAPMLSGQMPATPLWSLKLSPGVVQEDSAFHCVARTYDVLPAPQTQHLLTTGLHPQGAGGTQVVTSLIVGTLEPDGSGGWNYFSEVLDLPETAWLEAGGSVPAPGGSVGTAGIVFFSVAYRDGSIWAAHHVLPNVGTPGNPTPGPRLVIRWYEIGVVGGAALLQYGDIDAEQVFGVPGKDPIQALDPSISVNAVGDMALTYTVSGPETYPSMAMAYRYRTSPEGELPYSLMAKQGVTVIDPPTQSDYSGMEVDTTGCFFWGHSMLGLDDGSLPTNRYQSWIARLGLCVDDTWADFDGDAELTLMDWLEFDRCFQRRDRRADVDRDRRHTLADYQRVSEALRHVR